MRHQVKPDRPRRQGVVCLSLAGLLSMGGSHLAYAQAVAEPTEMVEEVVVTGSRIERTALESATPVTVLGAEAIASQGITNVSDLLRQMPAASTLSSGRTIALSNFSTVDLRRLGPTRTLVLVDGRRFVPGVPGTTTVDLNAIPTDFIERVDIVTGGASAVYGSEAVAGVVNIILKDHIEGLQVHAQYGVSAEGDNESISFGGTLGGAFDDDRGSAMLHFGYSKDGVVRSRDRAFSSIDTTSNGLGVYTKPAFSSIPGGGRYTINGVSYRPDGVVFSTPRDGYNRDADAFLAFPQERYLLASKVRYDLTDSIRFTLDGTYSSNRNHSNSAPTAFGQGTVFIGTGRAATANFLPADNPFIPAPLRALITPGTTTLQFVSRSVELGPRVYASKVQGFNITPSLSGTIGEDWKWDAYYAYGRTTQAYRNSGTFNPGALQEALTVTAAPGGGFQCANPVARAAGCVPYNLFGVGAASAQALAYIKADSTADADLSQHVAAASVSGKLFDLPAGPLQIAAGGEYREISSNYTPDALTQAGLNSAGVIPRQAGRYDVKEVFGEVDVPLLKDLPLIKRLSAEAAYRYADYSTIGGKGAWKAGLVWQPLTDLRLRGVYATATRAPNIIELFSPPLTIFPIVADPCAGGGVVAGLDATASANRRRNCLATPGITPAFAPTQLDLTTVIGTTGGNANLDPETAKTLTLGGAYTPDWLPNFTLTVDYYRIKIEDAIQTLAPSIAVDQCVNQTTYPNNVFCGAVTRDPVTGNIRRIDQLQSNIANRKVSGVDVEVNYRQNLDELAPAVGGTLTFNLLYSRLFKDVQSAFTGATPTDFIGTVGFAEDRFVLRSSYERGPLRVAHVLRYIGPSDRALGVDFVGNEVKAVAYQDLQLSYEINPKAEAYFGVTNLLDKDPPLISTPYPSSVSGTETVPSVYETIGQSFYGGVKVRF